MSQPLNKKRSSSNLSYSQSVQEGLNPLQYTPGYEEVLQNAGVFMNEQLGQTISDTSRELCEVLLNSFFPPPSNSLFRSRSFLLTLDEARNENESRVQRDILPLLVPCASLLYIHDRLVQCQHLAAKIQSEWTKVAPLAGPLPIPDYTVGLKPSAFTRDEISQLQIYTTSNKATLFRDALYFPFLICEVSIDSTWHVIQTNVFSKIKCGEKGLSIAERQSMHFASIAVNAIVELFRDRAVSRVGELHQNILAFSISHDHTNVRIYGHYARIEGDKITLHRHLIRSFDLRDQNGREKWTTYHIVRKIYDYFAPIHLERIRGAIAQLSESFVTSITPENVSDTADSQSTTTGASASQNAAGFKRRKGLTKNMLELELDRRQEMFHELEQENARLKGREELLMQPAMPPPSNAITTEFQLQRLQQQMQGANSRNDSIVTMLRQELERQRQENERQRQENERQRQENERQTQEMNELKDLLKQSLSAQPK